MFLRVIGEHLPQCSQPAYANQRPLDSDVKEWFASAFRAGLTPAEALDFFDCHLDLLNQRAGHLSTRELKFDERAIRPILRDPPVPQKYREWCRTHWSERMRNVCFYPSMDALHNIQQAVRREGRVHADDGISTYSMLIAESGVQSGDESLLTVGKQLTDQRVLYWREQHCGCAPVKGVSGKVCTKSGACTPFSAILQESWQREFARQNPELLTTWFIDETYGVCGVDAQCGKYSCTVLF